MPILDKLQSDVFNTVASSAVDGDTILFSLGEHTNWGIKNEPFGWGEGDHITIQGKLSVEMLELERSTTITVVGAKVVLVEQPGATVSIDDFTYSAAALEVTVEQPEIAQASDVIIQLPIKIIGDVQVEQPYASIVAGTGDTEVVSVLDVTVEKPTATHSHESIQGAGVQEVAVEQPATGTSTPVGDDVMWIYTGSHWLSLQTHTLLTGFSNTSPYTGDEFCRFGAVLTDANTGIRMRRACRILTLSIHSDVGIGTPPSSSCSVQIFVDGASQATLSWDGSSYGADVVDIDVDVSAGSFVTFKYVDDAGGQSAGKVVVAAEYRWRRT